MTNKESNKVGKDLGDVLNECQSVQEERERAESSSAAQFASLNADIPASVMKDLKLISVYNNKLIRNIVADLITRYVKKEKKKMIESLMEE